MSKWKRSSPLETPTKQVTMLNTRILQLPHLLIAQSGSLNLSEFVARQDVTAYDSLRVSSSVRKPVFTGEHWTGTWAGYLERKPIYDKSFALLHSLLETVHCTLWRLFTVYAAAHML